MRFNLKEKKAPLSSIKEICYTCKKLANEKDPVGDYMKKEALKCDNLAILFDDFDVDDDFTAEQALEI